MADVHRALAPLRDQLVDHEVYARLTNAAALRVFLQHHVFAVWDFMSLVKHLQRELTCVSLPWRPPAHTEGARLINEIVLAEETDERPAGGYASHLELYLEAMDDLHASRGPLARLFARLDRGMTWTDALNDAEVPLPAAQFVATTLRTCESRSIEEVAAFFVFGREDVIPDMFRRIVVQIGEAESVRIERFLYYLDRHITIDGDQHGPASERLLAALCGDDETRWQRAAVAGREALEARIQLWNGIRDALGS